MSEIPRPDFIDRSPTVIEPEVTAAFEAALGKQLFPGQLERLLLNVATYRELLVRIGIQYAAEQNLVNYADDTNLEQLGAFLGVTRLGSAGASVTLRFTRSGTSGTLAIPAGSSARQPGSTITFATAEAVTIANGQSSVTATAIATTAGANTNGFLVGAITEIISAPAQVIAITNTTVSSGGADVEIDDALRNRIKLAPNRFSVAGSKGAYAFHTFTADASIVDVAVLGPEDRGGADPVTVDIYPLTNTGPAATSIISAVEAALNLDTIRPLTDIVNVEAPPTVTYSIDVSIGHYESAEQSVVQAAVDAAITEYADTQSAKLGLDIVPSQIIDKLQSVPGVYSVTLNQPSSTIVIAPEEWPQLTGRNIAMTGANVG